MSISTLFLFAPKTEIFQKNKTRKKEKLISIRLWMRRRCYRHKLSPSEIKVCVCVSVCVSDKNLWWIQRPKHRHHHHPFFSSFFVIYYLFRRMCVVRVCVCVSSRYAKTGKRCACKTRSSSSGRFLRKRKSREKRENFFFMYLFQDCARALDSYATEIIR